MPWTTALAIFFVLWWLILFMTLPFGVRTAEEAGEEVVAGQSLGAPVRPRLGLKVLVTTAITGILVLGTHLLMVYEIIDMRALLLGQ